MTERLKVMLVLTRLNVGGVSHQAILLGKELQARGCDVVLVCGQEEAEEGNMLDEAAAEGLRVVRVESLRRRVSPLRDLRALFSLWGVMRGERPHVVQTNMAKAGQLGRLAAKICGVPVILHVFHGHVFYGYFDSLSARLITAMERWVSRLGDRVITLTGGLRRELAGFRIAPEEDIVVIPSLFDARAFEGAVLPSRGQFHEELGLRPDTPLVGMVGRLVAVKNPKMLLDAASMLRETHPAVRYVLVGDGDLRTEMERYADARDLRDVVVFTGWRADLPRIYADLTVAVVCSLNEGSPISALEAMAARVPVVATRVGGLPDLLTDGETGVLIDSEDTAALAAALRRLLDGESERELLCKNAYRVLTERFSVEGAVDSYLEVYAEVLGRKGYDAPFPVGRREPNRAALDAAPVSRVRRTA